MAGKHADKNRRRKMINPGCRPCQEAKQRANAFKAPLNQKF